MHVKQQRTKLYKPLRPVSRKNVYPPPAHRIHINTTALENGLQRPLHGLHPPPQSEPSHMIRKHSAIDTIPLHLPSRPGTQCNEWSRALSFRKISFFLVTFSEEPISYRPIFPVKFQEETTPFRSTWNKANLIFSHSLSPIIPIPFLSQAVVYRKS